MKQKIVFTKSPLGEFRLAYKKGDIAEFDKELAAKICKRGYGSVINITSEDELPKNFPGYNILKKAGYVSKQEVFEISDLSAIKGLTKTVIAQIKKLKETKE